MKRLGNRPWEEYYSKYMLAPHFLEVPMYSILAESALNYRERTAITFKDQTITYGQLKEQTDKLVSNWQKMEFKKGERIALMAHNDPHYIVSYYAALALGLIVVQIDPKSTPLELLKILIDAKPYYAKPYYIVADVQFLKITGEIA